MKNYKQLQNLIYNLKLQAEPLFSVLVFAQIMMEYCFLKSVLAYF